MSTPAPFAWADPPAPGDVGDTATLREQLGDLASQLEALRAREARALQERTVLRLQGLGQITAGVAHEINTPLQFIGDNLHLIQDGVHGMRVLVEALRRVHQAARRTDRVPLELLIDADTIDAHTDFEGLTARVERGFHRAFEGIERISSLVDAMRRFSHPREELGPVDINEVLETTLIVARNEYKHVATIDRDLGALPQVQGHAGELGQVFLNLIVNAAHAIADLVLREPGTITVRTRETANAVIVTIVDTGCGIPAAIRERVFEPFFTTKEPGRGTGQGLAIVHAIVHDRHHGEVWLESAVGSGTAVHVLLPIDGRAVTR